MRSKSNTRRLTSELVASAIATKLAYEIDPNNKVIVCWQLGKTICIPVLREMLGWPRRRPQELFLYRCRAWE